MSPSGGFLERNWWVPLSRGSAVIPFGIVALAMLAHRLRQAGKEMGTHLAAR